MLKGLIHFHSKYSFDCYTPVTELIKQSKKIGLNGFAITDHSTISGVIEAKKINKDNNFIIIVGCEITLDNGGEVLGLFLNENIKSSSFYEVYDEIKDQDGVVILPHPFRSFKKNIEILNEKMLSKIKIIEGINSGNTPEENQKAINLAKQKGLIMTAGSDAHHFSGVGKAYTIFNNKDDDLKKQLIDGNIRIFGDTHNTWDRKREFFNRELNSKNFKKIYKKTIDNFKRKIK